MSYSVFPGLPFAGRRRWLCGAAALAASGMLPARGQGPAHGGFRLGDRVDSGLDALGELRPDGYRKIGWPSLMPPGFKPAEEFGTEDLMRLRDSDPKAIAALERLRRSWMNAPTVSALDGQKVLIPGFAVLLTTGRFGPSEFLLVPNYGACIHVPPPPANQAVHVILDNPDSHVQSLGAYWIGGILRVLRSRTSMGAAGYRLNGRMVAVYHPR